MFCLSQFHRSPQTPPQLLAQRAASPATSQSLLGPAQLPAQRGPATLATPAVVDGCTPPVISHLRPAALDPSPTPARCRVPRRARLGPHTEVPSPAYLKSANPSRAVPFAPNPSSRDVAAAAQTLLAPPPGNHPSAVVPSSRRSPGASPQGEETVGVACCCQCALRRCNGIAGVCTAAIGRPVVLGAVAAAPAPVPPSQLASPRRRLRPGVFPASIQAPSRSFSMSPAKSTTGCRRVPPRRSATAGLGRRRPSVSRSAAQIQSV
jgi:hypothetical protein